jgi:hypothetical protein
MNTRKMDNVEIIESMAMDTILANAINSYISSKLVYGTASVYSLEEVLDDRICFYQSRDVEIEHDYYEEGA